MAIGNVLPMDASWITLMEDSLDDLIYNFGKDCLLVFPAVQTECPNCIFDNSTRRSSNKYKPGGPKPFTFGICPVCGGAGIITSSSANQPIRIIVRWNVSDFKLQPGYIDAPFNIIETEGLITDLSALLQSRVLIVNLPFTPYVKAIYNLHSEPIDPHAIAKGKTFVCHWKRQG